MSEESPARETHSLESLLGQSLDLGNAAEGPGDVITTDLPSQSAATGIVIADRYTLLEPIGEGGMGEVWIAQQTAPLKRLVALKLIKAGMDSRSVLARFEQERQALAIMDHPNIARVLDAGMTGDRHPFFVMELVKGRPLTQFCDEEKLGIRQRLELFVPICQAIQHAHQKGIVHRDLKPSNILVTIVDGRPTPKVIDFGVAKAMAGKLTDATMETQFGAIVGTLEYMSPEQAGFSSGDIDTRSDIYSLGVILYELTTGRRPFEKTKLRKAAFDEMIRMIREDEPSRPSARLSTDDALPSLAATRQTEPRRLTQALRGELDWVIMKCLEKQRDRRYESVSGLAREVQRYLADEPVEARPPSTGYRLRKFVKRNKGQVAAAAVVLLALIGGMVGTTFGFIRAEQEMNRAIEEQKKAEQARDEERKARDAEKEAKLQAQAEQHKAVLARDEERKARDAEKEAKLQAQAEQRKAERAQEKTAEQRQLALDTVRDIILRVDELMKNDVKLAPLRVEIIQRMLVDVDRIRDHAVKNPLEDRTEALAYSRIGEIYFHANRIQDSAVWYRKAYKLLKGLLEERPEDPAAMRSVAAISHQLSEAEWRLGNGAQARILHADALRLHQKRREKSEEEMEKASADHDIAESFAYVAYDDLRLGNADKALENYRIADLRFTQLPPPLPNFLAVRRKRCEIQVRMGDARSKLGEIAETKKHYLTALEDRERIAQQPVRNSILLKVDVGQSRMYLSDFYLMALRDFPHAFEENDKSHQIFAELAVADPDNLDVRQRLGAAKYRTGCTARGLTGTMAVIGAAPVQGLSIRAFADCLKLRQELAAIDRKDAQTQVEVLLSLARTGQGEEAEHLVNRLLDQAGDDRQVLFQICCGLSILSGGDDERARRCRERCFQLLDKLIDQGWRDAAAFDFDPDFDFVRDHKRFEQVLRRLKR